MTFVKNDLHIAPQAVDPDWPHSTEAPEIPRESIVEFISKKLSEPGTSTHIVDMKGERHTINGDEIHILADEIEPRMHLFKIESVKGKETIVAIGCGVFTIGAVIAAIAISKYRKKDRL